MAILAWRPFPPVDLPPIRSRLGGVPLLPDGVEWPRTSNGTPLHFLALIDCSELKNLNSYLPDTGILLFFALIDEEMDWQLDSPDEYCRVLYFENGDCNETSVPDDLPSISGAYHEFDKEFGLPEEQRTCVYPSWPLKFASIWTWSDKLLYQIANFIGSQYDHKTVNEVEVAFRRARAAEVVRVTGLPTDSREIPRWEKVRYNSFGHRCVVLPDEASPGKFPHMWIIVDRVCRVTIRRSMDKMKNMEYRLKNASEEEISDLLGLKDELSKVIESARFWTGLSNKKNLENMLSEVEINNFREWFVPLCSSKYDDVRSVTMCAIRNGMSSAVKYCGQSEVAAANMPREYMISLESQHLLTKSNRWGIGKNAPRAFDVRHHQLLGYARLTQDMDIDDDNTVLLLHLVSDMGVDFMFCDLGEIEFRINKDDLKAKRFENSWAVTCGG